MTAQPPNEGDTRRYDSSYRAEQARATQRRIIDAAQQLFLRDGYSATSLRTIAEAVGVAVPTIYASVGNKLDVLRAVVHVTVRGDDDPGQLNGFLVSQIAHSLHCLRSHFSR